jgi:PEP-CTERM motif
MDKNLLVRVWFEFGHGRDRFFTWIGVNAMNKFLLAGAAAVMALSAVPASATVTFDPPTLALDVSTGSDAFGATFINEGLGTMFTHVFTFSTVGIHLGNGSTITTQGIRGNNKVGDVDFTSILLDGFAFTQVLNDVTGAGTESWVLGASLLGAGPHTLTLTGKQYSNASTSGSASYGGTLNVASVPEPGMWALMLAGFGLVASQARRRRRTGSMVAA